MLEKLKTSWGKKMIAQMKNKITQILDIKICVIVFRNRWNQFDNKEDKNAKFNLL